MLLITLSAQTAVAWKPKQHVGLGHPVVDDLLEDDSHKVTLYENEYSVNSIIADAIADYPQYYLAGTWGPDAWIDMYFGQSFIHPDTKSEGGTTWSKDWQQHVFEQALICYLFPILQRLFHQLKI